MAGNRCARALTLALVAGMLVLVGSAPARADGPQITVSKRAGSTVLVGGVVSFTLTASNPQQAGAVNEFNVSFTDQLPPGVTYVSGSTTPTDIGDPEVSSGPDGQSLVWADVADVRPGASTSVTFQARVDPDLYPVGSTFSNSASGYANSDPTVVPAFGPDGSPTTGTFSESAASNPTTTTVSALDLTKASTDTPEGELLRGVHTQSTVYTLRVTGNQSSPTEGTLLVDYLPAGLEFLACGGVDNSPPATAEYTGSGRLTAVPDAGADCRTPTSVDTVQDPAGQPAGVYTRVAWNLGTLAPGEVVTVSYAAGVPLLSNTMAFPAGRPSATSLEQGANLDNNTGAPTREGSSEISLTNHAVVTGSYQGDVADGTPSQVEATTDHTVTAEDVAMRKTVSPGQFAAGDIATYTLTVRTSEYVNASDIVVTDHLPDGLCPLSSDVNYQPDADPSCAPGAGLDPTGADYAGVVANPDGSFDLTFSDLTVGHDGTATITYRARMRPTYENDAPTASGDSFVNTAALTATTQPRPFTPGGPVEVGDESSATLTSGTPTITKQIQPDVTPYACSGTNGDYLTPGPGDAAAVTFEEGSRVCFLLRATFPSTVSSKNVTISDVIPAGLTYEAGSARASTGAGFATTDLIDEPPDGPVTWRVGDPDGGDRFVSPGQLFEARFSAIVADPAAGPGPQELVNRVKLGAENTDGSVGSRRDDVTFFVAAPPPATIAKSAERLSTPTGPLADGAQVRAEDALRYTVTVGNDGSAADRNAQDLVGPDVWDVLPAGIDCAAVTTISDQGACTDPGQPGQPTFSGNDTRSAIRWNLPDSVTIAPGDTLDLAYDLTVPADASVALRYTNTASVASYGTEDNIETIVQHHPAANIDTTTPTDEIDAPAATDDFTVVTPDVGLTKSNVTAINDTGNIGTPATDDTEQGVIGELVTYTVTATVPAHSTVYDAVLADPMPTGVTLVSSSVASATDGSAPAPGVPPGFVFDVGTGTLTFPAVHTNDDGTDDVFVVTIAGRVSTLAGNTQGVARTNTATFTSTPPGGAAVSRTAQSSLTVVEPAPTLSKTDDDANGIVTAEQPVEFTLTAGNAAGRPTLHDAFVVDCVPDGMTVTDPGTASVGGTGCASGQTRLLWSLGDLDAGESVPLTYTAEVDPDAISLATYTNTATLSGSSLDDNDTTPTGPGPLERGYTATADDTVQVAPAEVTKTVDRPTATIGERRTYTTTLTVPQNVNFYDAIIVDQLPPGLDASTLRVESTSCVRADAVPCTVTPSPLTRASGPGGSTLVGFGFGDVVSAPSVRILTGVYSVVVKDADGPHRGDVVVNEVHAAWNTTTNQTDPTRADATLESRSNDASAPITVVEPDLGIDKTVSDANPEPGEPFTYTVRVANSTGSDVSDAYDTTVVDHVPAGVVVESGTISNGGDLTCTGGTCTITWQLPGPIAPGTPATLTYRAELAAPAPTTAQTNTADITSYFSLDADVTANDGDRQYDGPQDSATVQPALPHVSVDKTIQGGDLAYLGEPTTWQLTITSDGDTLAHGVDATDLLPPNWTYDSGSAVVSVNGTPLSAAASAPTVVTSAGVQRLTWTDIADLPPDQDIVITFAATPGAGVVTTPGVGHAVDQTNTASVGAEDASGSSGSASGSYAGPPDTAVAHIDSADVVVNKSHTDDAVAGEPFSWTVRVSDRGPDPAVGPFTVTDSVPPGLVGATASGPGWNCSTNATTLTCTRGDAGDTLASGESFPPITVTGSVPAAVPSGTEVTNTAHVTDRTYDPALPNNTDQDPTRVTAVADLAVDKTLATDLVAGGNASYDLEVSNNGPSVHVGTITVSDTVPAGTTFVSQSAPGWTFTRAGDDLTWTRSDPAAVGPLPTISVTVQVDSDRVDPVSNQAEVEGSLPDPDPDNNVDVDVHTPDRAADLIIEKAHDLNDPDGFQAGGTGTYRFDVVNAGPSSAQSTVRITDTLPGELTFASFRSVLGGWSCSAVGQDVTCDLQGPLAAGGHAAVEITVDVDPNASGDPLVNSAHVESPTTDPNPGNNDDDDDTDIDVVADLAVHKSHTGIATAGEDFSYSLSVDNNGSANTAGPITLADVLPAGMSFVSASGTSWSCSTPDGGRPRLVRCVYSAGVASGDETAPLTLVAHVDPDAGPAELVNRAAVDGPPVGTDDDLTNNFTSDPTQVLDDVEVSVDKAVTGPNPVEAGSRTTFTVTAHNDGPSTAHQVHVTDTLPAGLTLVSAAGPGWTCSGPPAPGCTLPTLAPGATSDPVTVVVEVGSAVADGATLDNVATVATASAGDTPAGNTDDAQLEVVAVADLALDKRHPGPGIVVAGQQTRYVLDVTNAGPSDTVSPLTVVDELPAEMTYVGSDGGWTCTAAVNGDHQELTCTLDQALQSGQEAPPLGVTVLVSGSAAPGQVTNEASVSSPTEDEDETNNRDSVDVTIVRAADVSLVKTHEGDPVVGQPLTWHLAVHNAGPSDAPGLVVTDTLPIGVDYVSATGDGWDCSADAQVVTCTRADTIASDADAPDIALVVDLLPGAYPRLTNTAVVDATPPDVHPRNNTGTDTVAVPPLVNLTLTKHHVGPVKVGSQAVYALMVTNQGPTPDPGPVTVTDRLPAGLSYVASRGADWTCAAAGQVVRCTHPALAIGARAPLALVVDVLPAAYPSLVNTAVVGSRSAETRLVDNVDSDQAAVAPLVRLSLEKEVTHATPDEVDYDLATTDLGPNDTTEPLVLVDDLPTGLHYVSATGPGWTCTAVADTVTCTHPGSVEVGEVTTVHLTTRVDDAAPDEILNLARVSGGGSTSSVTDSATVSLPRPGASPIVVAGDDTSSGGTSGGVIPDTGGPRLATLLVGLLLLASGLGITRRARRRPGR